jgi:hypothetical protein
MSSCLPLVDPRPGDVRKDRIVKWCPTPYLRPPTGATGCPAACTKPPTPSAGRSGGLPCTHRHRTRDRTVHRPRVRSSDVRKDRIVRLSPRRRLEASVQSSSQLYYPPQVSEYSGVWFYNRLLIQEGEVFTTSFRISMSSLTT